MHWSAHAAGSGGHRADVGDDALGAVARSRITAHRVDAGGRMRVVADRQTLRLCGPDGAAQTR
ncbi:MAG: hypothetical protein H0Z53_00685 [Nitrosospira sp.]|nr:hypothetical protein [Nitrosospira sp.]